MAKAQGNLPIRIKVFCQAECYVEKTQTPLTGGQLTMSTFRLHSLIGLGGVDTTENPRALRWAKRLEIPTTLIALWILVVWYLETRHGPHPIHSIVLDVGVWAYFFIETSLLFLLVGNRRRYLRNNWLNVVIILAGLPVLWGYLPYATGLRSLRLLIFVGLLLQLSGSVRQVLARNHLGMTLLVSAVVVVVSGYLIAGIDPGIKSPEDGIWWAIATVSSVGYGDVVPISNEGRMFATLLILMGMALFSIVTANLSVFFISQAEASGEMESPQTEQQERELEVITQRLARIEAQLELLIAAKNENRTPEK